MEVAALVISSICVGILFADDLGFADFFPMTLHRVFVNVEAVLVVLLVLVVESGRGRAGISGM